jgi:hypothetical protein
MPTPLIECLHEKEVREIFKEISFKKMALMVAPPLAASLVNPFLPVTVEHYANERRENYTSHPEQLHFRAFDGVIDHRLYLTGRSDGLRVLNEAVEGTMIEAQFANRPDSLVRYKRQRDPKSNVTTVEVHFEDQKDGIMSICMTLRSGETLDASTDTASTLFREKALHTAAKLDSGKAASNVSEIYQDAGSRLLRVTRDDPNTVTPQQTEYQNDTPNNEPLYESCKMLLVSCVQSLLWVERELLLLSIRLGTATAEANLNSLAKSLFATLDAASIV